MSNVTRLKPAWRQHLLRHLHAGRTLTECVTLLNIGRARVNQECRLDPEFRATVEQLTGRPIQGD